MQASALALALALLACWASFHLGLRRGVTQHSRRAAPVVAQGLRYAGAAGLAPTGEHAVAAEGQGRGVQGPEESSINMDWVSGCLPALRVLG